MPTAHAETVRALWERLNRPGVEAVLDLLDDDVELHPPAGRGAAVHGAAALRDLLDAFARDGVTVDGRLHEVEEHGDAVVASGTLLVAGRGRPREYALEWVYQFSGGRVRRLSAHRSREEALAALARAPAVAADPGFAVRAEGGAEGEVVVRPTGELDIATAPDLERALADAGRPGARVLVDLSGLTFMDSTGLRAVIRAAQAAAGGGWDLRVRHGPPAVRRVFELSGMLDALPFEEG